MKSAQILAKSMCASRDLCHRRRHASGEERDDVDSTHPNVKPVAHHGSVIGTNGHVCYHVAIDIIEGTN